MKKRIRFSLVFVIAVLAACLLVSGCSKSEPEEEPLPDLAAVTRNTAEALFGDWGEALDLLEHTLVAEDGSERAASLSFQLSTSAKETGTQAGLTARLGMETDAQGRSRVKLFLGDSLGEKLDVEVLTKGRTGAVRLESSLGTYKRKSKNTFRVSWDTLKQQMETSAWNPAVNPESPLNASVFGLLCDLADSFGETAGDTEDIPSSALAAIGAEMKKRIKVSEQPAQEGTDSDERQFILTVEPEDFVSFADFLDDLGNRYPLLGQLLRGESGTDAGAVSGLIPALGGAGGDLGALGPGFSGSASLTDILREGALRLDVRIRALGDRFSEVHAELTDTDGSGRKNTLTADLDFRYGEAENGCTLRLSADAEAANPLNVSYTIRKEGPVNAFSLDIADSSGIRITGSFEPKEDGITFRVDSIRIPDRTAVFTPGKGIRTEESEKTVHPKMELTVEALKEPLEDPFETEFDFGAATASQVKTVADGSYLTVPLTVLTSVSRPDYGDSLTTLEGYVCRPDDALRAQGQAYSELFAAYLQTDPVTYPCAVLKDDNLGCWYLLQYDKDTNLIYYVVAAEEPTAYLSVYHPAAAKSGALEMHDWKQQNIPATCLEPPVLRTYCTVCGAYYDREVGSPLPHKMIEASYAYTDINGKTVRYILHYCADCRSNLSIDAPDFTLRLEELENTKTFYVDASGKKSLSVPEIHIPYWIEPKSDRVMDTVLLNCFGVEATVLSFAEGVRVIAPETRMNHSVKTLILPKSLESADVQAFLGLTNLEKVLYAGTEEEWQKIEGWPKYVKSSMPNVKVEFNYTGK